MTIDVEQLAAIDVHVHAERNHSEPQDPVTTGRRPPTRAQQNAAKLLGL